MADFFENTVESLRNSPVGPVVKWSEDHPRIAAWIVLAAGMVILLVISARDVGLLAGQWAALIAATVAVAGLCVWIISWEDEVEAQDENEPGKVEKADKTKTEDKAE